MSLGVDSSAPGWINHVEKLVNKALQLDEETLHALAKLDGKVIAFEFSNTQLTVFLFPSINGLVIKTAYPDKPDVLIKGTPGNFVMMLASSAQKSASLPTDMQVIGDIGLAQRFQQIMRNIEIDLEEPLSRWVGDNVAYRIGKLVRGTGRFAATTGKTLSMDMSEYLRYEIEMLPDDLLVEEFCQEVDVLREDVDRFTQRVNKLEARINNKKAG